MRANDQPANGPSGILCLLGLLFAVVAWIYWPVFEQMVQRWSGDPQYTHGYIVPLLSLIVLWFRRASYPADSLRVGWWGFAFLLVAGGLRLGGSMFAFEWVEAGSLLLALAGAVLLAAGPAVLRWSWPALALLVFALPWPWQLDLFLTQPLRRIATICSTYTLQTLGEPALARGNIITINQLEVGVVEACSGLGMLMAFFALSAAVSAIIERPVGDRIAVFLSAIPIGILMNVARISLTVFLYRVADAETAQLIFHDVAGWVMMPAALGVLWLELCFLERLTVVIEETGPVPVPVVMPLPPAIGRPKRPSRLAGVDAHPEEAKRSYLEVPDVTPRT